ncbi:N-acyl amino acid synthase FeeM domain-containing protein [Desulfonatronum thioautotrophicum]|uniref:N-acyl amino acid synthase FeeM domain-containing protein n=1 Tax=Desulfonatronum thioautotrophicum TaxID=617001 RepID=UPI0005EBB4BE|nr:hypothetical protein [Desulfonatronum thioautotrophicum]
MAIHPLESQSIERRRSIRIRRSSLLKVNLDNIDRPNLKLAEEREDFEQSFSLVHQEYVKAGYLEPTATVPLHFTIYSLLPQTTTFLFREYLQVISTVTQVMDSKLFGLPMDVLYRRELDKLRAQRRKVAEISALATHSANRWECLFIYLSRAILRYSMHAGVNDLCIMVNPKHVAFYKTIFLFEDMGAERYYPEVDAPAVALRLNLDNLARRSQQAYNGYDFESDLNAFFCGSTPKPQQPIESRCLPRRKIMPPEVINHFFQLKPRLWDALSASQERFLTAFYPSLPGSLRPVGFSRLQ